MRHFVVVSPDLQLSAAGGVAPSGRLTDAHLDLGLVDAAVLDDWLPLDWPAVRTLFTARRVCMGPRMAS